MRTKMIMVSMLLLLAGIGFVLLAGSSLALPYPARIGSPPPDLQAETVTIPSRSGSRLAGWLCHAERPRGTVALMHGVRANRLSQVERARLFRAAGYDVLLFDFQAHGESPGGHITFGHLESRDAEAALGFLRARFPGRPLAAIGTSLGGASLALARHPLPLEALVLESVYPTIDEAVADRLAIRFGPLGPLLAPLLLLQIEPRLGVPKSVLRPIDHLADLGCPLLMLAGDADGHTTPEETKRLYAAARAPKELWLVPGAAHVDLERFAPEEYRRRVLGFLEKELGKAATIYSRRSP
jgi:fermentation-respiration switch protein FrsA (DUF1100 family)